MFSVSRHDSYGKGPGQVLLGKRCKLTVHSDIWIFVFTGNNFRVMLVRN